MHWPLDANAPTASSTIALNEGLGQIWSVNPDNDTVTVISDVVAETTTELATGDHPVAVQIAPNGDAWVVNRKISNDFSFRFRYFAAETDDSAGGRFGTVRPGISSW